MLLPAFVRDRGHSVAFCAHDTDLLKSLKHGLLKSPVMNATHASCSSRQTHYHHLDHTCHCTSPSQHKPHNIQSHTLTSEVGMPTREEDDALFFGRDAKSPTSTLNPEARRLIQYINVQVEAARGIVAIRDNWPGDLDVLFANEVATSGPASSPATVSTPALTDDQSDGYDTASSPESDITESDFDFVEPRKYVDTVDDGTQGEGTRSQSTDVQLRSAHDSFNSDEDYEISPTPSAVGDLSFEESMEMQAADQLYESDEDYETPPTPGAVDDLSYQEAMQTQSAGEPMRRSPSIDSSVEASEVPTYSRVPMDDGYESDSSTITVKPPIRSADLLSDTSDEGDIEYGSPVPDRRHDHVSSAGSLHKHASLPTLALWRDRNAPSFAPQHYPDVLAPESEMLDVDSCSGDTTDEELKRVKAAEDARGRCNVGL